jgi:membrane protein
MDQPLKKRVFIYRILKTTVIKWVYDEAPMMGAALAYYALFSIAPLLMVALAIAGVIFAPEVARGELQHHLTAYFGESAAQSIEYLLSAAEKSRGRDVSAVVLSLVFLFFGASSVFTQLKLSLNRIWKVEEPRHTGFKAFLVNRGLAIIMVIVVGFLLLSSLVFSAVINRVANFAAHELLPFAPITLQALDLAVTFLLITILFAVIFRYLPDIRLRWRNVILGAVVTAILFLIGRYLISLYIARGGITSGYGAAGSVLILLLWIYYSAQIFLFGAEFTHVYSRALHLPAEPLPPEPDEPESKSHMHFSGH